MIKQTITWSRTSEDIPWPWDVVPESTFSYVEERMTAAGFLDFIPSETPLEFKATILWESQAALDAHMETEAHLNILELHNSVMEEHGVTKTITIEDFS